MNTRTIRWLSLAVVGSTLAACGGGGGYAPPPPPPPAANTPPVAAFAGAATVAAGTPIAFDASGSTDADGDALTYSWDFGGGRRGGGARIARVFDAASSVTVRLTVDDGRGGVHSVERSVAVTAGPTAIGSVNTMAIVRDTSGAALSGVTVAPVNGGASATSSADGVATVVTERGRPVILRFSKAGYADQIKTVALPAGAESGYLELAMLTREPALTLPSAAAGGTLTGKDGARVSFAPNSIVDSSGNPVIGAVQVAITPVDVAANVRAFPGRFEGLRTDGAQGLLLSYGTAEFVLSAGGAPAQLAPGKKATIEIPIYTRLNRDGTSIAAGNTFPLWSLDERTGGWIEEGVGTVVAAATPSDFALRGEVTHFSWWNHDQFTDPPARPKPKCLVDTNLDGMLEDLTGTGYCWHYGTGPEQPDNSASALDAGRARALAEPRTGRIPTYVAEASTPATGGVVLPIPADMDITFHSYALNGTLMGSKIVRLGPNVEQDVPILLEPVKNNAGTLAVALPYDDVFAQATGGEIDRFTFAVEAGAQYEVTVVPSTASLLAGTARVLNGSTQLVSGSFNQAAFVTTQPATAAGTFAVEVVAGNSAPGSYRLKLRKINNASCASPTPLAIPSTTNNIAVPAGSARCFELALTADDIIEVVAAQNLNAEGTVRLFAPSGDEVGVDGYGTTSFDGIRLRAAVAQTGSYRLEIVNTRTTSGTINGLAPAKLVADGVLTVPQSVSFSGPAGGNSERYYIVKPPVAGQSFALMLTAPTGISQGIDVRPGNFQATTTDVLAMWPATSAAAHSLVQVFRQNASTAWDFQLATSVPETIALNTDVALNAAGPGLVKVFRLDATSNQPLSMGRQWSNSADLNALLRLLRPSGTELTPTNQSRIHTPSETGPHTLLVRNSSLVGGAFTIRVNSVAPPESVTLGALEQRTATLALGEVRRFSVTPNLTDGQVLALSLDTPTELDVTAVIEGGSIYNGNAGLSGGPAPRSSWTGPRYVQQSSPATLLVYSSSTTVGNATGQFTLGLQSPAPVAATPGAPIALTTGARTLHLYGFALAGAAKHILCTTYPGADGASATVWGPSAPFVNYGGDLFATGSTAGRDEQTGDLRAGQNTLSIVGAAGNAVTARVLALAQPAAINVNAAATSTSVSTGCERRYFSFAGTAGQSYTVRATAAFSGSLRVRKQASNGDWTSRGDPPFGILSLPGSPTALASGVEKVLTVTIPNNSTFGNGTYIIEVDADDDAVGDFSVQLTQP